MGWRRLEGVVEGAEGGWMGVKGDGGGWRGMEGEAEMNAEENEGEVQVEY